MHVAIGAASHPGVRRSAGRGASFRQPPRAWARGAAGAAALAAAALACGACAHAPREFDVTQQVSEARLPPPGPVAADLSGTWELDPRAGGGQGPGMEGGRRPPMGGGGDFGGGGFGGGGFPGERGAGRGRPAGGREGGRRGGPDSTLAAPRGLVVTQTDSSLTFGRTGGAASTLYFDGRTVYAPDARGEGEASLSGRWHGKRFEVRRELPGGRVVDESYELSKDGGTLTGRSRSADAERSGPGGFEVRRVYRRAAALPGDSVRPPPARRP